MLAELDLQGRGRVRQLLIDVAKSLPHGEEATVLYLRGELGEGLDAIERYERIARGEEALPTTDGLQSPPGVENSRLGDIQ